jgi:hypothetical protein
LHFLPDFFILPQKRGVHKEVNPMENKDEKNEELLNKQLQLLAEKSLNADADTLVSLTDVMCKVYKVLNGDL